LKTRYRNAKALPDDHPQKASLLTDTIELVRKHNRRVKERRLANPAMAGTVEVKNDGQTLKGW
jgi:hypothetical protein